MTGARKTCAVKHLCSRAYQRIRIQRKNENLEWSEICLMLCFVEGVVRVAGINQVPALPEIVCAQNVVIKCPTWLDSAVLILPVQNVERK